MSLLITSQYTTFDEKDWNIFINYNRICNIDIRSGQILASEGIFDEEENDVVFYQSAVGRIDEIIKIVEKRIDEIASSN